MKRRISLLLCTVLILTSFSGCAIKKDASTTGETSNEVTPEITGEITLEVTKEPAKEQENKAPDTSNQNQSQSDDKTEATPEFYDFMTLDPDVDINNKQVREDIHKRIYDHVLNDAKPEFTKKENYLYELYDKTISPENYYIMYELKPGQSEFYSLKTKKNLSDLGFEFGSSSDSLNAYGYECYQTKCPDCKTKEEAIIKVKEALKILLEDHNVIYIHLGINPSLD